MPVCVACGKYVNNMRKHKTRARCGVKPKKGSACCSC